MRYVSLVTLCIFLLSCSNSTNDIYSEKSDTIQPIKASHSLIKNKITGDEITEYLDFTKMTINNKFPILTSFRNIETIFGKPDSVVKIGDGDCISCFRDENSKRMYFGLSVFENFKDSLELSTIDFTKGKKLFLQIGKLKLNGNTKFEDIKNAFPNSSKNIEQLTTEGISGIIDYISIPVSKDPRSESVWMLMFQNGRLVRVDWWFNCC